MCHMSHIILALKTGGEGLLIGPTNPCIFIESNEAVLLLAAIGFHYIGVPALCSVG